jgi:hypothetical protein
MMSKGIVTTYLVNEIVVFIEKLSTLLKVN